MSLMGRILEGDGHAVMGSGCKPHKYIRVSSQALILMKQSIQRMRTSRAEENRGEQLLLTLRCCKMVTRSCTEEVSFMFEIG